ncbi:type II toxin-antitoxin system YafO family toxin [Proteus vulgaris]|uniref:type II toxin-antitoxin system YafO family toxin n=1 Tax=Proteus TaxID=583 RepID=UPI0018E46394|nr:MULTISPECIES: type II toxin-antitoxin system YafO family toxin [Proteus]MBI6542094.1 type II toxin-antitoxin system YafO family toxin [Proteus vulgaris]
MTQISIHPDIEYKTIANEYAHLLKLWKEDNILSNYLGANGRWENNAKLCQSLISKIHIRMPLEPGWNKKTPQIQRKSNHYLVYCQHWLYPNRYQIIAIMSPNAHEIAKTSFLAVLEKRAEEFQNNF